MSRLRLSTITLVLLTACTLVAQEIRRPTTSTQDTAAGGACTGPVHANAGIINFYDAAGGSTSGMVTAPMPSSGTPNRVAQSYYGSWQAASVPYSSLNLKIHSACVPQAASCGISYSTNGGASYTVVRTGGWSATTDTVALSPTQDLSQLRVRACADSLWEFDGFSRAKITGYDIRTEGVPLPPPAAPSNLASSNSSNGQSVTLTWSDNSNNESLFRIARCTGAGCSNWDFSRTAAANATSFVDSTQACTTYRYAIQAENAAGGSGYIGHHDRPTTCIPGAPSNLDGSAGESGTSVTLNWIDNAVDEASFQVERCTGAGCSSFGNIGSSGANAASFVDNTASPETTYRYRIYAANGVGNSPLVGPIEIVTPKPALSLSTPYKTFYTYDLLGNLTRVEQRGGTMNPANFRVREFKYDSLSRLKEAKNPETGTPTSADTVLFTYDANGNLTSKDSAEPNQGTLTARQVIGYCYDDLNRLKHKRYGSGDPCQSPTITYNYDQGPNGKGRRTNMTDQSGSASWAYDVAGRAITEDRTISGVTKSFQYGYNFDGSMSTLNYPSGLVVTYDYDNAGRPISAAGGGTTFVSAATYTTAGALSAATYNGVINIANTYNKRQQPINLSVTSPSGTILSLTYDFSLNVANNGNVLQITNGVDNTLSKRFTYDKLNRLATAFTPFADTWGNTFEYDAWGNLNKMLAHGGKPLGQNLNQTSDAKNRFVGFDYDAAGNMTQNGSATYQYDAENRLADVGGLTFTYDGDGKRVKKSNGTLYWTGMGSDALAESNLAGTLTEEYIFFGGKRVARRDLPSQMVHFFFSDHLGSTNVVTNATGSLPVEESSDFYPYGGERIIRDTLANQDYKFTGKERDTETDLDYFGARYYAASLARFSTVDPFNPITDFGGETEEEREEKFAEFIGDPQNWNRYAYTLNNPLKYIDEDGRVPILVVVVALRLAPVAVAVGARYGPQVLNTLRAAGSGAAQRLFNLGPAIRGGVAELLQGSPASWRFVQGIDNFIKGNAISMKSLDIFAKSYQNVSALASKLGTYVTQLQNYAGGKLPGGVTLDPSQITGRILQVILPPGKLSPEQMKVLEQAVVEAAKQGVKLEFYQAK